MATFGFVEWQQLLVSSWFWKLHQLKWNVAQSVLLRIWKPVVVGCAVRELSPSLDKYSPFVEAESPANIFWEGCICPPQSVYEDDKKARPLGTHRKTEGSQLAELRSSWLLFWRNFWKLVRFMDSCRSPALFSSASKCSFKPYFFSFEDSRFVFWWPHNILYGWRK